MEELFRAQAEAYVQAAPTWLMWSGLVLGVGVAVASVAVKSLRSYAFFGFAATAFTAMALFAPSLYVMAASRFRLIALVVTMVFIAAAGAWLAFERLSIRRSSQRYRAEARARVEAYERARTQAEA